MSVEQKLCAKSQWRFNTKAVLIFISLGFMWMKKGQIHRSLKKIYFFYLSERGPRVNCPGQNWWLHSSIRDPYTYFLGLPSSEVASMFCFINGWGAPVTLSVFETSSRKKQGIDRRLFPSRVNLLGMFPTACPFIMSHGLKKAGPTELLHKRLGFCYQKWTRKWMLEFCFSVLNSGSSKFMEEDTK